MASQNPMEIREKIITFLRRRGPSLPVHIAKETGLSILFASAFLSELVDEKQIRFSDMKVGSSPIYFLNEQAYMLERFGQNLKTREKDAFNLLKEKKFLVDKEQSPQIRVALRAIKDFAISFNKGGQTIWRYYTFPESEFKEEVIEVPIKAKEEQMQSKIDIIKIGEKIPEIKIEKPVEIKIEKPRESKKEHQKELGIFDKSKKAKAKKPTKKKKAKIDDSFFNRVKEWIANNSMEILDIQDFSKNELHLKVKKDGKEHFLAVYNKKRLADSDFIKANKKAKELGLSYSVLSFGELQKKISEILDAARNLFEIKKME